MIDNLTDATRLLNAAQLMLLGKDNQPISDLYYALQIAVDSIEELKERREADKWIPVSKRLPNTLGVYNVTRKIIEGETSYVISDACYFDGQNTWHADTGVNHGRPYITDVIAWKPKPEPYESEEE